jgi:hypothetical protein
MSKPRDRAPEKEIIAAAQKRLRERLLRLADGDAGRAAEMERDFYAYAFRHLLETDGEEAVVETLNSYWRSQDMQLQARRDPQTGEFKLVFGPQTE